MSPVNFSNYTYVPILGVRPAEMQGLEELPAADKETLLPYIVLQPWVAAMQFDSVVARLDAAFGSRSVIVDLTDDVFTGNLRPVHARFQELRDASDGYRQWYDFVESKPNYIPSLQLSDPSQIVSQLPTAASMGRGLAIRMTEEMLSFASPIASAIADNMEDEEVQFIIDFRRQNRDILTRALVATNTIGEIRYILPNSYISVSASTFPDSFVDVSDQEIFERRFFEQVVANVGGDKMIYCDRGSVRADRQSGGGGAPAPRIDNAVLDRWYFFREPDEEDRDEAYRRAAARAVASPSWTDLGIWGTEIIKQTEYGGQIAIVSPKLSTAARINIHLHIQNGGGTEPTETQWID